MNKKNRIAKNSEQLLKNIAVASESELAKLVQYHNRKYFLKNDPVITDEAFDKLVEALRLINPHAPVLTQIGPGETTREQFGQEVVHIRPMLSLDKCYDDASFFKWAAKINGDLVAMPKIDGVACSLIYSERGELILASTRGDGRVGEDVTKNALLIPDLPSKIPSALVKRVIGPEKNIEIRGEVFLPLSKFKDFAEEFVNPRNLSAGVLKLKEGDVKKNSALRFLPYDVRGTNLLTETKKFLFIKELGFSMMPWSTVKNNDSVLGVFMHFLQERRNLDFDIDGVVFRADSIVDQRRLGETAHHPRYAIAYKFQGDTAQTKLVDVEWSVARSGLVTPVAIVSPVFLSGASITRASLHNLGIFRALDLRENSLVEINRRGGVIPHLERVLRREGAPYLPPDFCPSCNSLLVTDGDFLRCVNPEGCSKTAVQKLVHFCHVIGIEGMGEKIVFKLYQAKMLQSFADIFRLKAGELATLERMGDVLANKIVLEIDRMRVIDLATFIRALGIEEVGTNISELVAENFHTLTSIRALTREDLLPIRGIGESIAMALVKGLEELADEIDDLLRVVKVKDFEEFAGEVDNAHPLFNKSVLFTGKMAHLERKAAQQAVKRLGGKAPAAMSQSVDYLVIGDEGSPLLGTGKKSTKHKEAEKLIAEGHGIKIVSETEFLKMVNS